MSADTNQLASHDGITRHSINRMAMALFLFALPQFAIPTVGTYRPPAASVILLLAFSLAPFTHAGLRFVRSDPGALRRVLLCFFGYCILSAIYGYWLLTDENREVLQLTTGDVEYLRVAFERLLQIALMIAAFEIVYATTISPQHLMRWWLRGLALAVLLHALTYGISDDWLAHRAGTFNEGNQAGLYYLISLFVALEYRRTIKRRSGTYYALIAVIGILLSRSSAAILLLGGTMSAQFILRGKTPATKLIRALLMLVALPSIAMLLSNAGLDFGIGDKLFEQSVTPESFSRMDRLESISAALQLFERAPILGNGLQSYSFLSNELLQGPLLMIYDGSYRRIPNNIYAEVAAELGIFGMLLFGAFIVSFLRQISRSQQDLGRNFRLSVWSILLYWLAFPTYSVVFIWAFFGLTLSILRSRKSRLQLMKRTG